MTRAAQDLLTHALALPEAERLEMASELIASVDGPPDADWEATWLAEMDRRVEAAKGQAAPPSDWSDARKRILARLASR